MLSFATYLAEFLSWGMEKITEDLNFQKFLPLSLSLSLLNTNIYFFPQENIL